MHLPWCVRKCPYCDFNSHTAGDAAPKARYIEALQNDLAVESGRAGGRELQSIFLGGGTPSLFTPAEIGQLLDGVRERFSLARNIEITMEANPGTVECGSPAGYRAAGVNRLSVGAQSFDDELLVKLGRIHSSNDITRAVQEAREAGFSNINIDLMHGLPGQSVEMAMSDLRNAIRLDPSHISWYQLTLEPNTVFHARPPPNMPDDDLAFEIQEEGQALLARHGFQQYEISAYARDGLRCNHNLNYWLFGDYLAAGAGAHGKLTAPDGVYRYQKPAHPLQYMNSCADKGHEVKTVLLDEGDLMFEFMLNALRLSDGFAETVFVERTGLSASDLAKGTQRARDKGLLRCDDRGRWQATPLGQRFLNDLQAEFVVEAG